MAKEAARKTIEANFPIKMAKEANFNTTLKFKNLTYVAEDHGNSRFPKIIYITEYDTQRDYETHRVRPKYTFNRQEQTHCELRMRWEATYSAKSREEDFVKDFVAQAEEIAASEDGIPKVAGILTAFAKFCTSRSEQMKKENQSKRVRPEMDFTPLFYSRERDSEYPFSRETTNPNLRPVPYAMDLKTFEDYHKQRSGIADNKKEDDKSKEPTNRIPTESDDTGIQSLTKWQNDHSLVTNTLTNPVPTTPPQSPKPQPKPPSPKSPKPKPSPNGADNTSTATISTPNVEKKTLKRKQATDEQIDEVLKCYVSDEESWEDRGIRLNTERREWLADNRSEEEDDTLSKKSRATTSQEKLYREDEKAWRDVENNRRQRLKQRLGKRPDEDEETKYMLQYDNIDSTKIANRGRDDHQRTVSEPRNKAHETRTHHDYYDERRPPRTVAYLNKHRDYAYNDDQFDNFKDDRRDDFRQRRSRSNWRPSRGSNFDRRQFPRRFN